MPEGSTRLIAAAAGAAVLFMVAGPAPAEGVEKRPPASRAEVRLSYAPLVKKVAPAVVNIYTKRVVRSERRSPLFNDPFFRQFFGRGFFLGRPRLRIENSLGSGVIVSPDGVIVTNNHVIAKAQEITVVLSDRRELDAQVIIADERTDLAVLRVETGGEKLPYLEFRDSDELEVGDLVLAIGNPFGVGQTVTSGIVSALARAAKGVSDFSFFIQTDAAINPGNSGGALVTMDGRVVGINTAIYSRGGGSVGIGFAIPANMVARVVESAVTGTRIVRPWFGVGGQAVTVALAASLRLRRPVGVIITDIFEGGPAHESGLRVGDVVVSVNGHEVENIRALRFRVAMLRVGGTAELAVTRKGKPLKLRLALRRAPEIPPRQKTPLVGRHPLAGATVANLSPALAEELNLNGSQNGVIVLAVAGGSAAGRIDIRPGDMVIRVNRSAVTSVDGLTRVLSQHPRRWNITIRRGSQVLTFVIEG